MSDLEFDVEDMNDPFERQLERRAEEARERATRTSATHCAECDDPIPEARRLAVPGVDYCVHCQEALDQARAGYAERWRDTGS